MKNAYYHINVDYFLACASQFDSAIVNLHIKGLEILGCECKIEDGYVIAKTNNLKGGIVCFDIPSVGATENIMMARK